MPEKEREALLSRINQSLHPAEEEDSQRSYHREIEENERKQMIEKDIAKLSLFSRFLLWLRSKFGGKSLQDAYLALRLKVIKRKIQAAYPGITGFETRDLNPRLAEEVFRLFSLSVPLKRIYQHIWVRSDDFERMFMTILEGRIHNPKKNLTELVPMKRLQQIYGASGTRDALQTEVTSKLNEYVRNIPDSVFDEAEKDLEPLDRTRDIVLYPYASFFQLFHYTPMDEDIYKKTFFKSASAMLCLEHLEKLHYALFEAASNPENVALKQDIGAYLTDIKYTEAEAGGDIEIEDEDSVEDHGDTDEEEGAQEEGDQHESGEEADVVDPITTKTLLELISTCKKLYRKLPLELLGRYFLKDPYYELVRTVPSTSLKELYTSVVRLRFVGELDKLFPQVQRQVLEDKINELFEGKTLRTFRNYREYQSLDYEKLGLPFFSHIRSVMLLYNYIDWFYRSYIQEAVQLLERSVLGQNRITRDRLRQHAAAVEDTGERIKHFDYSLSSDSEDGRTFQRLRFTLVHDPSHQKMYQTLVLQKDREVRSIIDRGIEAFEGLERIFRDVAGSSNPNIVSAMKSHYFVKGSPVSLEDIVTERADHIHRFTNLIKQVVKTEGG